jgi:hypothetical protein
MSREISNADEAVAARAAGALLGAAPPVVNGWSMLLALAAMLTLVPAKGLAAMCLLGSVVIGLMQAYFAIRCRFDAALFARLDGAAADYARLDAVLAAWGMRAGTGEARSVDQRVRGALRLWRLQRTAFALQLAALLAGAVMTGWT